MRGRGAAELTRIWGADCHVMSDEAARVAAGSAGVPGLAPGVAR